jgi:PAS domain S-box-containing protein
MFDIGQRYRDLLEQAADGIFLLDENGNFLMANSEICKMLGCTREELLRMNMLDTYPNELREEGKARLEAVKSGDKLRFERLMKKKDGSFFPVEISARRLADGTVQAIARDITERKRAESELALERSLLNALMDNIPDKIYFKNIESRFVRGSRAHAKLFGLNNPSEMIGKTDMDFFSEEHARQAFEDEQRIIRTDEPLLDVEEKETWPNRPDTWVLTTKMPLRDQEGNTIGTFGISRDITERKRAEEALRESEEKYRTSESKYRKLIELAPEGIGVVEEGRVIFYNSHLPEIFGYSYDEMRGMPLESILFHEDMEKALGLYASRAEGGLVPKSILRYVTKHGKVLWVETVGQRIEWEGRPAVLYFASDATERKNLEEQFAQAQKIQAIGQLTGGVAHDFNNILQVITGCCEFLKERLSQENQTFVAEITKAANRASALTRQLLAFSRKQILKPRVVNAKSLIRSVQMMLERVLGEDVELGTFIDPNTGNFLADPGQMEQVLLNLAVNARDAMPWGGKLTIETSNRTFDDSYVRDHLGAKTGQYVCIAVSDTGIGMNQDTLSHLYEPFFTTKERGKGTGLGLATTYGIVKQSGGYVNCYSEMGKGTTFTIYLPLTLAKADISFLSASTTPAPRGTETILLVDDDSAVRKIAGIALKNVGYVVIEASEGEEALAEVAARRISVALLVTDVVLPRMSGKEFARNLHKTCPGARILYISGYTANVISHHGILDAGLDFLQKPFSSTELLTTVREILDRPRDRPTSLPG